MFISQQNIGKQQNIQAQPWQQLQKYVSQQSNKQFSKQKNFYNDNSFKLYGKKQSNKASQTVNKQAQPTNEGGEVDNPVEAADDILMNGQERMDRSLDVLSNGLNSLRTGRANPQMLNSVKVDYYGVQNALNQVGSISVQDAQTLAITPYDQGAIKDIEKALVAADLGMSPNNDGVVIRLVVPMLTQQRRQEMQKTCSKYGEEGKIHIRNVRNDINKRVGKLGLSDDNLKLYKDKVQQTIDKYVEKADNLVKQKEKELSQV